MTYVHQMPKLNGYIQPTGGQVYQPLVCNQQHQQGYNTPVASMGVPSLGYAPVQVIPMPVDAQFSHVGQPQQVIYSTQQCQSIPQNSSGNTTSPTAAPCVMYPLPCLQQSNPKVNRASSVISSTASTPLWSCYSPGYVNAYVNTPAISCTSCTPQQCSKTYLDVPPVLNIIQRNIQSSNFPQQMSCNINMNQVQRGRQDVSRKTSSIISATDSNSQNKPKASLSSHFHDLKEKFKSTPVKEDESVWVGNLKYEEYRRNGASNLFITWPGPKSELIEKLRKFNLEVRDVLGTSDSNICNVIFQTHPIARKAFTMQNKIRLRIVPPKNSDRMWLRNPSPTFLVKYETKCRLVVKTGKAECHDIVGELLEGCLISADQLKGNRIRVVCCEGSFTFPGGKVVEMKGVLNKSGKNPPLGWISYRSEYKKESYVIRRSWCQLKHYIYNK